MRSIALSAICFSAAAVTFAQQPPPVIRQAPDLTVVQPNGNKTTLASQKGKVVVLDFIFTTCPHCKVETEMLERIVRDMGPKGLQVLSVAVNDNAQLMIPGFVEELHVPWPVGYAPRETLLNYQGFSEMDRWVVPQVIVIDRKGMIRAATPVQGDPNLQSETYMRALLTTLLNEKAAPLHTSKSGTH